MNDEKEYIAILDCYFEYLNDINAVERYYKISDTELSKLCVKVRTIEHEKASAKTYYNYVLRELKSDIKELKKQNHVYKIELGRCVRKLTRIYQKLYKYAYLTYAFNLVTANPYEIIKPDAFVDMFRNV